MKTILIVEDDVNIQNILAFNLEKQGYKVFTADNGYECLEIVKEEKISLILMDIMMPNMNGFDCTLEIRKFSNVPIIMLTALEDEPNILHGYQCGIDDYIIKPFSMPQVFARIEALLRRVAEEKKQVEKLKKNSIILRVNNIELNTQTYEIKVGNKENILTPNEFELFMFLYKHPNIVFNRDQLLREVRGTQYLEARSIDVCITRMRNKTELDSSNPQNIKTRRGKGYYFNIEKDLR